MKKKMASLMFPLFLILHLGFKYSNPEVFQFESDKQFHQEEVSTSIEQELSQEYLVTAYLPKE